MFLSLHRRQGFAGGGGARQVWQHCHDSAIGAPHNAKAINLGRGRALDCENGLGQFVIRHS
jgi:hypothetical protein